MISVAMALYNSTRFIEEQLDSIRNQTVPVDEVVMVDDGSSDETVEWVGGYIGKYELHNWHVESHEKNKGYIETFYDAIEKCSSNIIILCDHDDVWHRDKVEIIKKAFEDNEHIEFLATSFNQIDENGRRIPIKLKFNRGNNNLIRKRISTNQITQLNYRDVAVYNVSPGCTCAFRKDKVFVRFRHSLNLPHDWVLTIIAALRNTLYYLDIVTTDYRIYEANTIGLGHASDFNKRKRIIAKNCIEKYDACELTRRIAGGNSVEYKVSKEIYRIFKLRNEFMQYRKITIALKALILSLKYNGLYESVLMDIYTMTKARRE